MTLLYNTYAHKTFYRHNDRDNIVFWQGHRKTSRTTVENLSGYPKSETVGSILVYEKMTSLTESKKNFPKVNSTKIKAGLYFRDMMKKIVTL